MATRIFRVDLTEGALDFQPVATEPGLPMLDRLGANYTILQRWLGDLVAEPEWQGETSVNFFIHEEKRGRLTNVVCQPASKADLDGPLKKDLELISTRLGKVKPESTTEQSLYKITRQTFRELTEDLELSDHDCYFFKYREDKEPWRLVWCWGYQRADMQPAPAIICNNVECNQLYVHRPKTKNLCPNCQKPTVRKRGRSRFAVPLALLGLLLLALMLFVLFNPPRLVVTPGQWAGPPGANADFSVALRKWYFFESDVTGEVVPQSKDRNIIDFSGGGLRAKTKNVGRTKVLFLHDNRSAMIDVSVGLDNPPKSIALEPASVKLGIGSTQKVKAMGLYEGNEQPIDISDLVQWSIDSTEIAFRHDGRWEGKAEGKGTITAEYYAIDREEPLQATAGVEVAKVDYKSLEMTVDPALVAVGQDAAITIDAVDAAGARYSMLGSTWLLASIAPDSTAELALDYLTGRSPGGAELKALVMSPDKAISLDRTCPFTVTGESLLASGVFSVEPGEVEIFIHERRALDIASAGNEPIEAVSSNPDVVAVLDGNALGGVALGSAEVAFKQGDESRTVKVSVVEKVFDRLRIEPALVSLNVGGTQELKVYGITKDGSEFELFGDELEWIRQPLDEYMRFDRDTLTLTALTPCKPQDIVCRFGTARPGEATAEVVGDAVATLDELDALDGFLTHPPVPFNGRPIAIDPSIIPMAEYDPLRGVMPGGVAPSSSPLAPLPQGSVITAINGESLIGLAPDVVAARLAPLGPSDIITYTGADGIVRQTDPSLMPNIYREAEVTGVDLSGVSPADFSATIHAQLRPKDDYRVIDSSGNSLTEWTSYGPNQTVALQVSGVPRAAGENSCELAIERRNNGGQVRQYSFTIQLRPGGGPSEVVVPDEPPVEGAGGIIDGGGAADRALFDQP